jgi:glutamine cyclotransferase
MSPSKVSLLLAAATAVGFGVTASHFAIASTEKAQIGALGPNHGIVVDPKTFTITKGVSKTDPTAHIVKLGAREVTNGAVIFRVGDKLYIADANLAQKSLMNAFWDAYDREHY